MHHDTESRSLSEQSANSSRLSSDTARRLAYVWARMTERYGQPWTSVHGTTPTSIGVGEWGEIVADLTEDEIRAGFTADLDRASDYPPSSARFRAMCRPPKSPQRVWADAHKRAPRERRIETDGQRKHAAQAFGDIAKHLHIVPDDAA